MIQVSRRLASVDAFRAITMLLMIFVNDLPSVKDVPAWIDHAGEMEDRMGLADIVFPAFLFIVGLSIPFAIGGKLAKGLSRQRTLFHILRRTLALLIMGVYLVNYESYNAAGALLPKYWWLMIVTIAFFPIWLDYPPEFPGLRKRMLQGAGVLVLVIMALVYQGGTAQSPEWMQLHWYGILGLIGWSYLLCALIYFFAGDRLPVLWAAFLFLIGFAVADKAGWLELLYPVRPYVWITGGGALPALTMAGVASAVFYRKQATTGKALQCLQVLSLVAMVCLAAGFALRPLDGISKIRATPSWVLICLSISLAAFVVLAYIMDIKGRQNWCNLIKPAGTSTLTCYLLPYIHFSIYQLLGEHWRLPMVLRTGGVGILKSLVFAFLIIMLTGVLEKKKIRLSV